jgi:hypothetical protein
VNVEPLSDTLNVIAVPVSAAGVTIATGMRLFSKESVVDTVPLVAIVTLPIRKFLAIAKFLYFFRELFVACCDLLCSSLVKGFLHESFAGVNSFNLARLFPPVDYFSLVACFVVLFVGSWILTSDDHQSTAFGFDELHADVLA